MSSAAAMITTQGDRLPAYALFGAMLAAAGLPIYIHAPKFYADEYGVGLATLGLVLSALRLVDVVQDPLLGWLSARLGAFRRAAVAIGAGIMALAMVLLFAVTPPIAPLAWFALSLTLLFSGYSFLTINFYAEGVAKAERLGQTGHVRLAAWRETGALIGVSMAAVAPTVLAGSGASPYTVFAGIFAVLVVLAVLAMGREWGGDGRVPTGGGLRVVLRDRIARHLLMVAFFNAAPVAVSSSLFLFFVESRLEAAGWEGPLLLLFFLAAAAAAPGWGWLAARYGARPVLLLAMVLSIVAFAFTAMLGSGDALPFAVICLASGAALGADMTLLPAIFAGRMAQIAPEASEAFGLWSFVTKLTLALAAVLLLPVLEFQGFQSGGANTDTALWALTALYAGVPCLLKLVAITAFLATPKLES